MKERGKVMVTIWSLACNSQKHIHLYDMSNFMYLRMFHRSASSTQDVQVTDDG